MSKDKTRALDAVDPSTMRYIRQLTGKESAFPLRNEASYPQLSEKQNGFLKHYISSGGITKEALRASQTTREELDEWMADEKFRKAHKEAQNDWVEELRKAAMLRATAKSDVLLMFLLKSLQPDVFDDDVRKQQFVGLAGQNKDAIPVRATLVREGISIEFAEKAQELRELIVVDAEAEEDPKDS